MTAQASEQYVAWKRAVPSAGALLLSGILLAATVVRFWGLDDQSFWLDEAASWKQATAGGIPDVIRETAKDNYPPLHNLILWAVIGLFGDAEWWLRLPSALMGVVNVAAIYWVGKQLRGEMAGLIAAALLAISGFHIWYSQEARAYALMALSATILFAAVLHYRRDARLVDAVWIALAAAVLLYTHPYGALTWASIVVPFTALLIWRRQPGDPPLWQWFTANAAAGLLFLPWGVILLGRAQSIDSAGFWIQPVTVASVLGDMQGLLSGPYTATLVLIGTLFAIGFFATSKATADETVADRPDRDRWDHLIVLLCWAVGPIAAGVAASIVFEPVLVSRYLIGSLPAFLLLAAVGLSSICVNARERTAVAAAVIATGLLSFMTYSYFTRPDWRGAAALISQGYDRSICIVLPHSYDDVPFRYYLREPLDCIVSGIARNPDRMQRIESDFVYLLATGDDQAVQAMIAPFRPRWETALYRQFEGIDLFALERNR